MEGNQLLTPMSQYSNTLPQVSFEATYPQGGQPALAGPSRVDATHHLLSPHTPYTSPFSNSLGLEQATPIGYQDPSASHYPTPSQISNPYDLPAGNYTSYSPPVQFHTPSSMTISPYPDNAHLPSQSESQPPQPTSAPIIPEPWRGHSVPTSYETSTALGIPHHPHSAPPFVVSPISPPTNFDNGMTQYDVRRYSYSAPLPTHPLPDVPLHSPSTSMTYTPPPHLPARLPRPIVPYPPASGGVSGQHARLLSSPKATARRPRRCVPCIESSRIEESFHCPGRGGRKKCPMHEAVRDIIAPPKLPATPRVTPRITISSELTAPAPASAAPATDFTGFNNEPTGALQMTNVIVAQQPLLTTSRPRHCQVCREHGADGEQCPGRGGRFLCQYYSTTVGNTNMGYLVR